MSSLAVALLLLLGHAYAWLLLQSVGFIAPGRWPTSEREAGVVFVTTPQNEAEGGVVNVEKRQGNLAEGGNGGGGDQREKEKLLHDDVVVAERVQAGIPPGPECVATLLLPHGR